MIKIGRKKLDNSIVKEKIITMRVNQIQYEKLKALSKQLEMPVSNVLMFGMDNLYQTYEKLIKTNLNDNIKK